jgi:hypothetical protein
MYDSHSSSWHSSKNYKLVTKPSLQNIEKENFDHVSLEINANTYQINFDESFPSDSVEH